MAPKKRPKAQLTLLEFTRIANPLTTPKPSPKPRPPQQEKQQNPLKLPRATVPSIFRSTPSTPKRPSLFGSSADEAWEIGERILNGDNLNSRISYEEEGREIADDEGSDADFEQQEVVHHVAQQRPSLKRKHATSGLRDDRASMTKRSGNKKPKRRTPIKIATQCSMGVLGGGDLEDLSDDGGRRELIDQHEVILVEGDKSEMSGTDNEEADVSKYAGPVKPSGTRRRVSLAGSVVTPANRCKTEGDGKESQFHTPEEFALQQSDLGRHCENTNAPRKARCKPDHHLMQSPTGKLETACKDAPGNCSTRKRAREMASMFDSDNEGSPNRIPSSTRKIVRRLRVSDSDSSEAEDSAKENEPVARGAEGPDLSSLEEDDEVLTRTAKRRRIHGQRLKEGEEQELSLSEDDDEILAVVAMRCKKNDKGSREGPAKAVISNQDAKNEPRPGSSERDDEILATIAKRSSSLGGGAQSLRRRSVFDSKEMFCPALAGSETGARRNTGWNPVTERGASRATDLDHEQRNGADSTTARTDAVPAQDTSHADVKKDGSLRTDVESGQYPARKVRACESADKPGDDHSEVIDCDSAWRNSGADIIDIGSSNDEEADEDENQEPDDSSEEEDITEHTQNRGIVTRSVSQRVAKGRRRREPSPAFDLRDISDDSSRSSGEGSVQEVLSQGSVENDRSAEQEVQTPERHRRVRSTFLHSGRKRISITPESSPSPPSTKKRFRLKKLATKDSDDEEHGNRVTQLFDTPQPSHTPGFNQNEATPTNSRKTGEWYHERDISNFSSSSSLDLRAPPSTERKHSAQRQAHRRRLGLRVRSSPPIRKLDLESDSPDLQADGGMTGRGEHSGAQSPGIIFVDDEEVGKFNADQGLVGRGGTDEVIDLVDDVEADPVDEPPESNSPDQWDEIRNSSSARDSGEGEKECITVEDDDKPPPFNLMILCQPGESVKQMLDRVGEETIMDKVTEAQNQGRDVLGGEELGLTQSFNQGVFSRFSRTVVADQIGQKRKLKNVTEQALRGEYQFNYRGRNAESKGKSGGRNWYRGKGGWRGRGSSRGGSTTRGGGGRLANVRRRRT